MDTTRTTAGPGRGDVSFPRQYARTQRFTLGAPRTFTVSPDGERVVFLRSASGTDPVHSLWVLECATGEEWTAVDPRALLNGGEEVLTGQERARRERSRESSSGVVGYAVDAAASRAVLALSGRLFLADLRQGGGAREVPAAGPVADPQLSPDGRWIAWAADRALFAVPADGGRGSAPRRLAGPEPDESHVFWGLAEFAAAEELDRARGFWWSPGSDRLLAARVDEAPVTRWWIADPANPARRPAEVAYPAAGTPHALVSLAVLGLDGSRVEVEWDREGFPYLARALWPASGRPLLQVLSRDQRTQRFLTVDPATGRTAVELEESDPAWLETARGLPARLPDGRLLRWTDTGGARVLMAGGEPLTGAALHPREVLDAGADGVLLTASAGPGAAAPETGEVHVYRAGGGAVARLSREPGVHTAVRGGGTTVLVSAVPGRPGVRAVVLRDGEAPDGGRVVASFAERPVLTARPALVRAGERGIPSAVFLPSGYREGDGRLPVLMDPYGGPQGQRVLAAHDQHLISQWFADQGFAVVVADGRGTPGGGPAWEKAVAGDFAGVVLEDQVAALRALAGSWPLDLERVGIRGWSFGGWLAALAVLRRPDVFHAAVSGAPVTDLRLYDAPYMERYLGDPRVAGAVYAANSLVTQDGRLNAVEGPARPLMLVHGLADDNVAVAHTLRLSSALLAAGRPHQVLPLTGVTHMTPQEVVAENLLLLQVDFLKAALM